MATCSVMGVITQVYQPESGISQSTGKQWLRQTIIVQKITNSQYESKVALDLPSQKAIDAVKPVPGMIGEFFFDVESRESQQQPGKWFSTNSCYKVKPFQMAAPQPEQQAQQPMQQQPTAPQQAQPAPGSWNPNAQGGAMPF